MCYLPTAAAATETHVTSTTFALILSPLCPLAAQPEQHAGPSILCANTDGE